MIDISSLIAKHKAIRERLELEKTGTKFHTFGGISFYSSMSFSIFTDDQLLLAHIYFHRSYLLDNPQLDHKTIEKLHKDLVSEMIKRNLKHTEFDKLDTKLT